MSLPAYAASFMAPIRWGVGAQVDALWDPGAPVRLPRTGRLGDLFKRCQPATQFRWDLIGGSDAAAIMGLSSFGGPADVYMEKVLGRRKFETDAMRFGKTFEYGIVKEGARKYAPHSRWFHLGQVAATLLLSDLFPWLRFTPDVLFEDDYDCADGKRTHYAAGRHGAPGTDQVHSYELIQGTFYMHALRCAGYAAKRIRFWVHCIYLDEVLEYVVPYDETLGDRIFHACERFWHDHIVTKRPPPVDERKSSTDLLTHRFPTVKGDVRQADPDERALMAELRKVTALREKLEKQEDHLANLVREKVGDDRGLSDPELGSVTWTETVRGRGTSKESTSRTLRKNFRK